MVGYLLLHRQTVSVAKLLEVPNDPAVRPARTINAISRAEIMIIFSGGKVYPAENLPRFARERNSALKCSHFWL